MEAQRLNSVEYVEGEPAKPDKLEASLTGLEILSMRA